jgi:cyclase
MSHNELSRPLRLIARLDVKGENLIKGIHLEGLRVLGNPNDFARLYYGQGADEILFMDIVASLYGRSNLIEIVRSTADSVFIPITVGGGVRSIEDVKNLLRSGADKVAINTAAVKNPGLISQVSERFGSQCMVLSVEAKRVESGRWEVYTDSGREKTGVDVVEWCKQGIELGAGEILLTSIDQEGTRSGFDLGLLQAVQLFAPVPLIISGGYGMPQHLRDAIHSGADAVAFADCIHYQRSDFFALRQIAREENSWVRSI